MDKEKAYIITLKTGDLGVHGSVKLLRICYSREYTKKLFKQYREKEGRTKVDIFIVDNLDLIDDIMRYDAAGDKSGLCYFLWTKANLTAWKEWE